MIYFQIRTKNFLFISAPPIVSSNFFLFSSFSSFSFIHQFQTSANLIMPYSADNSLMNFTTTSAIETLISYSSGSAVWDTGYSADNSLMNFTTTSAIETLISYSSGSAVWDTGYSADNSMMNFTTTSAIETLISYSSASALLSA